MSIKVMSLVWENFPRGGSDKLVMLAMADWCNDQGGSLHPSHAAVAKKCCLSRVQAQRIIRLLEHEGWLLVVGNQYGGAPGMTKQYRLNVEKLINEDGYQVDTGIANDTGIADDTGITQVRDGYHPGARTGIAGDTQTTIEPSRTTNITMSPSQAKRDPANRLNGKTAMVEQVMAYLNLQASRNYRTKNPNGTPTAGALVIAQRLKEGYTVNQCKDVIGVKSNDWMGDEKMDQYLNPQTLFRKSNFDKYLAEAEAQQ